jgi:hypothetical protein
VIQALRESSHVICIKPPRELLTLRGLVFNDTEFWFTGSFNLRCMWTEVNRDQIPGDLQLMFPTRVVWIESFTAIGEQNGVDTMELEDPVINKIRENWNTFITNYAAEGVLTHTKSIVVDVETKGQTLIECEKAYNALHRNLKCFIATLNNPKQFLLADQLVPVVMSKGEEWLTPVTFMGYGGKSYPVLEETTEPTNLFVCSKWKKELREMTIEACQKYC